ncbi:MAG: hypothetical protein ACYDBB_16300 [Armatimonadota bacterium]
MHSDNRRINKTANHFQQVAFCRVLFADEYQDWDGNAGDKRSDNEAQQQ